MDNVTLNKREYGIDLLRMVAMLLIPVLHILGHGGVMEYVEKNSVQYFTAWTLELIAFGSVNCFALISGYVGAFSRFRWSRLVNLWFQVLCYSAGIVIIYAVAVPGSVSRWTMCENLIPFTTDRYWYITAYAGMFFFIPIMNQAIKAIPVRQMMFVLVMFMLVCCMIPMTTHYNAYNLNRGYSVGWLMIMYLLGGCIKKWGKAATVKKKWLTLGFVSGVVLSLLSIIVIETGTSKILGYAAGGDTYILYISPLIVMNAVCMLIFFAGLEINNSKAVKLISLLSPAALGVYLLHEHLYIRNKAICDEFVGLADKNPVVLAGGVIGTAIIIFVAGTVVDLIRIQLFKLVGISKLCKKIDDFLDKKGFQ